MLTEEGEYVFEQAQLIQSSVIKVQRKGTKINGVRENKWGQRTISSNIRNDYSMNPFFFE